MLFFEDNSESGFFKWLSRFKEYTTIMVVFDNTL
jgi:hypothetical protein